MTPHTQVNSSAKMNPNLFTRCHYTGNRKKINKFSAFFSAILKILHSVYVYSDISLQEFFVEPAKIWLFTTFYRCFPTTLHFISVSHSRIAYKPSVTPCVLSQNAIHFLIQIPGKAVRHATDIIRHKMQSKIQFLLFCLSDSVFMINLFIVF